VPVVLLPNIPPAVEGAEAPLNNPPVGWVPPPKPLPVVAGVFDVLEAEEFPKSPPVPGVLELFVALVNNPPVGAVAGVPDVPAVLLLPKGAPPNMLIDVPVGFDAPNILPVGCCAA
jgi:hypothetical protein